MPGLNIIHGAIYIHSVGKHPEHNDFVIIPGVCHTLIWCYCHVDITIQSHCWNINPGHMWMLTFPSGTIIFGSKYVIQYDWYSPLNLVEYWVSLEQYFFSEMQGFQTSWSNLSSLTECHDLSISFISPQENGWVMIFDMWVLTCSDGWNARHAEQDIGLIYWISVSVWN